MAKKVCDRCKKELPLSNFSTEKLRSGKPYPRNICKGCVVEHRQRRCSGNLHVFLGQLFGSLKNKRKKEGFEWDKDLTSEDLYEIWEEQLGRCALSGNYMTWQKGEGFSDFNISVDRISPTGPYSRTNLQLVCYRVNIMKHVLTDHELYWWCKNIVTTKEDF
jgi:hypothetical protein